MNDGDPGKGIHPLDPRSAQRARRVVDPLLFCPECGSDEHVESTDADTVTFTETGETVRAAVCSACKIMYSATSPTGKAVRASVGGGTAGTSISIPGAPTRPYSDPKLDPRLLTAGRSEDPRVRTMKVQLRRDVAYYDACRVTGHGSCRCSEIERTWSTIFGSAKAN